MLVFGVLVIGARDVRRATEFWAEALGLSPGEAHGDNDFTNLCLPDGRPLLSIQHSDHDVEPEPRLHLDLYARGHADQKTEIDRLIGLGAHRVPWSKYPEDADFVVLADTEGNLFCVIDNAGIAKDLRLALSEGRRGENAD